MLNYLKKFYRFLDDRLGIQDVLNATALHKVPASSGRWSYVFGSATLACLVIQVVTGVALALLYQPSSETAYESLQWISTARYAEATPLWPLRTLEAGWCWTANAHLKTSAGKSGSKCSRFFNLKQSQRQ